MTPEEKMAVRVLAKNKISVPYDLDALVEKYADIEDLPFPISADGVTIDVSRKSRPQILLNAAAPPTRRKFTLAHELGHIIIPWHTGTIVSHLFGKESDHEYRTMETEANRFAAELLMPSEWLLAEFEKYKSFADYLNHVIEASGASREAVLIKVFSVINKPLVCAELGPGGRAVYVHRPLSFPYDTNLEGLDLRLTVAFNTPHDLERFSIREKKFICWRFKGVSIKETDSRSWRDVLNQILDECGARGIQQSINAILPTRFHSCKHQSVPDICRAIKLSYESRSDSALHLAVATHPLFEQYIIKRVNELMLKGK